MQDYICTCIFLGRGDRNFYGIQVFMNKFRSMTPVIAAKLLDDLPTEFHKLRSFLAQCCIWSLVYWLFSGFRGDSKWQRILLPMPEKQVRSWIRKIPRRRKWKSSPYSCCESPHPEKPGELQSMGSQRVKPDLPT